MQALWGRAWASATCIFCFYCFFFFLPACQSLVSCSAVSSTCLSLRFVSILSLCSAVSFACLLFTSSVSWVVSLLCCFFCLPFCSPCQSLCSAVSSACFLFASSVSVFSLFLPLAFLFTSLVSRLSLFCCFFACLFLCLSSRHSWSNKCCWVTSSIRVLHSTCGSLRLGRHRCRRCSPIVKIRCTTHYMGLAQARPNYCL